MKKRVLSVLLAVAMFLLSVPLGILPEDGILPVEAATSGYYTYSVADGKATITDVSTSISGAVTIPSALGGYPVIGIGNKAFSYCSSLTSVTIPDSVTSIGDEVFYNCTALTSFAVGANTAYCAVNGVLFTKNKTALVCYPAGKTATSYTIPDGVTEIESCAFSYCTSLTAVTIPDSVTYIGGYAFYRCDKLTAVYITDVAAWCRITFNNHGYLAYDESYSNPLLLATDLYLNGTLVTELVIPDGVTEIGRGAFSGFGGLSVIIPDSVIYIDSYAFYGSRKLTSVTIPDGVTGIDDYTFSYCSSLTSVTIPNSMTYVGTNAFVSCSQLSRVHFIGYATEWGNITVYTGNSPLTKATRHYCSWEMPTDASCSQAKTATAYCSTCNTTVAQKTVKLDHTLEDATCTTPKTCTVCGEMVGDPLGHTWADATCDAPKTCTTCGVTEGDTLNHIYVDGFCTLCGAAKPTILVGSALGRAGETVEVAFAVNSPVGIKGLALSGFTYDSDKLELISGQWADVGGVIANWDAINQAAVIAFGSNINLSGTVFTLTFRIKEDVELCTLPISCSVTAKTIENGKEIALPMEVEQGFVQVGVPGDMNGDNELTTDDAILLLYHTMLPDMYPVSGKADVDGDGELTTDDAIYLLYHILLPEQYPLG